MLGPSRSRERWKSQRIAVKNNEDWILLKAWIHFKVVVDKRFTFLSKNEVKCNPKDVLESNFSEERYSLECIGDALKNLRNTCFGKEFLVIQSPA